MFVTERFHSVRLLRSHRSLAVARCTNFTLLQVKESVYGDENFSVSVNRSAFEIVATYKKEETGIDLVIRLPSCYPLRHVDVECTRSLGISEVKCRKWLLSLTSFVRSQVILLRTQIKSGCSVTLRM
jgi:hypothetical protein